MGCWNCPCLQRTFSLLSTFTSLATLAAFLGVKQPLGCLSICMSVQHDVISKNSKRLQSCCGCLAWWLVPYWRSHAVLPARGPMHLLLNDLMFEAEQYVRYTCSLSYVTTSKLHIFNQSMRLIQVLKTPKKTETAGDRQTAINTQHRMR